MAKIQAGCTARTAGGSERGTHVKERLDSRVRAARHGVCQLRTVRTPSCAQQRSDFCDASHFLRADGSIRRPMTLRFRSSGCSALSFLSGIIQPLYCVDRVGLSFDAQRRGRVPIPPGLPGFFGPILLDKFSLVLPVSTACSVHEGCQARYTGTKQCLNSAPSPTRLFPCPRPLHLTSTRMCGCLALFQSTAVF